jgi:hypothetical protein
MKEVREQSPQPSDSMIQDNNWQPNKHNELTPKTSRLIKNDKSKYKHLYINHVLPYYLSLQDTLLLLH